ncbi:gliding motility-associated C-terminal domain-containing protein [Subsaxibacter sp. CAU 1640]|uniref:gliding motility-associated C-terminal domain-containing protein n=1 Tax=Subsaxibacter sp. CAU 1640 TaxID=2933271 RepID=UPI0020042ED9|nr:gliding motility-associated C-terminal domain-containing protein [Subsaxibacter sp. CAU 1640]MCK7589647.1 gliding motility-associated C-terminal domain-containing protein [Subsaxibacter sp. CAU 1640]
MTKQPRQYSLKILILTSLMCVLGFVSAFSQCPTVINPTQSFCDVQAPTISNLTAIDNGGGIRWYATATSTSALSPATGLINGEDYYADDNSGTCGARQRVEVLIYGAPTGLNFQGVCVDDPMDATISDLVANGNDVRWYSVSSGGTALSPSTVLMDNTIYYADQSNPFTGCRTSRLSVFVNVGVVPVPTGDALQEFCSDQQPGPTVADLVASGNNNWYSTISSALPLDPSTPLVDGASYFATTVDPPCESIERFEIVVVFNMPNDPGANGAIEICETDVASIQHIDLFDGLNGSPMSGGTWIGPFPTTNGSIGTVNITTMTVVGSPYVFTYTVDSNAGCSQATSTVTVTILPPPNAGSNGALTLCGNDSPVDLFDSLGGTPDAGGSWSPALTSGNGVFDPAVDPAGTYTYTVSGTPPCNDASATVTVTILPPPNAGTNGSLQICESGLPEDLFNSLGGTPVSGGTWSPALASGTGVFDPAVDAPGTYTYTITGTPPCNDESATVTVTILPPPNAGSNGALTLCGNDSPVDLFDSLGGTPDAGGSWSPALASGTGVFDPAVDPAGTYIYTVSGTPPCTDASATVTVTVLPPPNAGTNGSVTFCESGTPVDLFDSLGGTPDTGGTWSPALASGTGVFDPAVDPAGTYIYTVTGTPPCNDESATVTVTILPPPNAGTNGSLTLCGNNSPVDLFDSLGGTPDAGGTWSPALASGTGVFDPAVDPAGTYVYTVSGTPPCTDASATVTVTVLPPPNAGTNGSVTFCGNGTPVDLFDSLGGTPDTGGTWSPALASGTGVFDPAVDAPGTYTYTITGTPPCNDESATVTVTILPPPNAGTNGSLTLCGNNSPVDLFNSLGGTPDAGGSWSPALTSGNGVFDPAVDPAGTYTYTVSGTPPCTDASSTVTVTVLPPPNAGTNGSVTFCESGTPVDLFDSLGGTPDTGGTWSPALASGTGVFDPAVDAPGTYTYTITGTPPCNDESATVTVTILPPPNAGSNGALTLCGNDSPVDLFDSLGGTPDAGGSWSPALVSGTGVFNPAVDPAGTYVYTVSGTPPCTDASATVTVTVLPPPNAGTNGSVTFCESGTPVDLFDSLGGTPDTGGTWSPALASGTGVFDPAVDAPGTYTYTIAGTPPCNDESATVTVTILPPPNAGTNGSLTLCGNNSPVDLFNSLGGTPDTGGTWSPALASGTGIFDPAVDPAGTYTYTVSGTPPCTDASATVTVTVLPPPNAGTNGSLQICESGLPEDLFNSLGGTPVSGGTWSPALASGTGVFDPAVDTPGIYTYTVNGTSSCSASATVTVSFVLDPNAGTDGAITFCNNDAATDLFNALGGTPDAGGTWSPALASGTGLFDPLVDIAGTYTYTVDAVLPCRGTSSAQVVVTINQPPDATGATLEAENVCLGLDNAVTISNATQLLDGNYDIVYDLTGVNTAQGMATVNFVGGTTNFTIPTSLLVNPGNTTVTIFQLISVDTQCGADVSVIAPISFEVYDAPTPTSVPGGNSFCEEDNPTIQELSANILETETITWYDAPTDGNAYQPDELLIDGNTYYASLTTSNGCESVVRLEVTVVVEMCEELDFFIPDGFSPNGDGTNDDFDIPNIRTLFPNFTLEIFNRYGNVLYKGNKDTPNWDGKSKKGSTLGNSVLPVGVYFYILEFNDGVREPVQGRVYLSR